MFSFRKVSLALAFAALSFPAVAAEPIKVGTLELTGLWTRATPPSAPAGGGYLTITNTGDEADRLVAVTTSIAGMSEIHEMRVSDGVMTMRELEDGLEIPAGGTVELAPGGFHLMFMALKEGIAMEKDLQVTLTFENGGSVDVVLDVYPIGSPGPKDGSQ